MVLWSIMRITSLHWFEIGRVELMRQLDYLSRTWEREPRMLDSRGGRAAMPLQSSGPRYDDED